MMLNIVTYLAAAVVMVPIASRLGLGSVLGYLVAGVVIGPWCLKLITDAEAILHFAEFGVVLLLFLVGLELQPKQLWALRKPIFGMGGGQLLLSTLCLMPLLHLFSLSWQASLVAALAISLSSTAIALQILNEKNLFNTRAGGISFSILLFQDLAVIPMMALIPLLGVSDVASGQPVWVAVLEAIGVVGGIILAGHYLLPVVMRFIAKTGIHELFTAFALLLVIGISQLMDIVGLSMALGTFIAGMILAESEYRHALETVIDPLKGLLMGLFFMAVGMSVDFGLLMTHPWKVALLVLLLLVVKIAVLSFLGYFGKVSPKQTPFFAFLLSQGGEFAFVVFSLAVSTHVMSRVDADLMILVVAVSMMSTPLLMILNTRFIEPRFQVVKQEMVMEHEQGNPVIIAGFGRFGQVVGRLLHAKDIGVTLLDHDPDRIEQSQRHGFKVFFGDAARLDLLRVAGAAKAKMLVIAVDDKEKATEIMEVVRNNFPHLRIVARVWDMKHMFKFYDAGLDEGDVHRETFESAMKAAGSVLHGLGFERQDVDEIKREYREHDTEVIAHLYEAHHQGDDSYFHASLRMREELSRKLLRVKE
ncbi:MAG: glutathione-regulated potassium-efflux system protein KefC [Zetaproteobacteria bacterium CG1_02_49_23]|nr:MAG: glutathione-regulated potassium-efflux system protein KefC [Zetaproteobacteria bacterium CG1_02_49_23]